MNNEQHLLYVNSIPVNSSNNNNHPFIHNQNNNVPNTYNYHYNILNPNTNNISLPITTSIPELTRWSTWGIWHKGIMALAESTGVKVHLCKPSDLNQCLVDSTEVPLYHLHFDENSTPDKIKTYKVWRCHTAIAFHIVQS